LIDGYPNFGRLQHAQILVLDPFQVSQQTFKAPIIVASPLQPTIGCDQDSVHHVGIKYTGLRRCSKGQSDDDFFTAWHVAARKAEDVVQVSSTDIDIREDRIYRIRIVMICHGGLPSFLS